VVKKDQLSPVIRGGEPSSEKGAKTQWGVSDKKRVRSKESQIVDAKISVPARGGGGGGGGGGGVMRI